MRIGVIGTGYVGLVTGTCLATIGHEVTCVDRDNKKIAQLENGQSPIYEPGLESLIKKNSSAGRLRFTTDLNAALDNVDMVFIAVGTPQKEDDNADLTYVLEAGRQIAAAADHSFFVVMKSTVPVGTCAHLDQVMSGVLTEKSKTFKLPVVSNPEFLKEGNAVEDFMRPDRIVIGILDEKPVKAFKQLYKPFIVDDPAKLLFMNRESSEMTKYAANAMLAMRISFMNEMSQLCEALGANIDSVRLGIGSDARIGKKSLYAGPGYGGSCFPKDVAALIQIGEKASTPLEMIKTVKSANEKQKAFAVAKIKSVFKNNLKGKKIALWGLAFKPGTDDVRESPALYIATALAKEGAILHGHDPQAIRTFVEVFKGKMSYFEDSMKCLAQVDAVVLVTEWSEYKHPNWEKVKSAMSGKLVIDLRNQYDREAVEEKGLEYHCIGRPTNSSISNYSL